MSETHDSWISRVGQWGLLARAGLLGALFVAYWLVVFPIAFWSQGREGVWAATLATLACLLSGWLAMMVTYWMAPPTKPAAHVLVGMLIRMSGPLLVCLGVTIQASWLADAGFAWYLVAAFCLGLALETLISVGQLQFASGPGSAQSHGPTGAGHTNAAAADRTKLWTL